MSNAIRKALESDKRLAAARAFVADFEAKHGVITDEEMEYWQREARRRSVSVRGTRAGESRRKYGK